MNKIKFAKVKEGGVIPSKRLEDAGYDIYTCFEEDFKIIYPNQTVMIPTGIASAFDSDYVMVLKERGSTGTKGIGQRAGIIDSNYRGEWLVPITNHSNSLLIVSNLNEEDTMQAYNEQRIYNPTGRIAIYPCSKAICQALLLPVPKSEVEEITYEELKAIESNRGDGKLGSSGK